MGFVIKLPNGTIVYERKPGQTFPRNTIFKIFCPSALCTVSSTVDYYVTMTDSWGDGWNGNMLGFAQQGSLQPIELEMNNVRNYGPIVVTLKRFQTVNVTVG